MKTYKSAVTNIRKSIEDYRLELVERNGDIKIIHGKEIGVHYNERNSINKILQLQKSILWGKSIFQDRRYYVQDIIYLDKQELEIKMDELIKLDEPRKVSKNVGFHYINGSYHIIKEEYGNKIIKDRLIEVSRDHVQKGLARLDLAAKNIYEDPRYTVNSNKVANTLQTLNRYVKTTITFDFGDREEVLDGSLINRWLWVDDNLEVKINETAIMLYVKQLSARYNTVGKTRTFKSSTGKVLEITGGLYGWKIDEQGEEEAILSSIKKGEIIFKEPIYSQRALCREKNDIGDTYVEINITRQQLWYYRDGKLLALGPVVTGNLSRGYDTVLGVYMLNYKQMDTIISGPGYEAKVAYWMPFYGNIGLHDASWRSSFGGEIYKHRGSHGCVNAPRYLAKLIFENIEEGIPIICYEE